MRLVIVSGLSGSGKTVALHTLEDEDYYCVDNLLLGLLPEFVRQLTRPAERYYDHVAVGIDARSGVEEMHRFAGIIEEVRATGLNPEIVYLQADVDTLIKRFSETRRKHPLTRHRLPLVDAINLEIELLAEIASHADLKIDTSRTNVHQLRELVRERVCADGGSNLSLLFQSFGYKHGVPADSDYVFDVRCLPNPYWEPRLRGMTGETREVAEYLESHPEVEGMFDAICGFLEHWVPHFERENRRYLTVSIGCTGGQHRSVYLADRLTARFRSRRGNVSTRHRELL
ncbi:MAG: RNase adapter RapZ [Gammaproteobacteria bacterium]